MYSIGCRELGQNPRPCLHRLTDLSPTLGRTHSRRLKTITATIVAPATIQTGSRLRRLAKRPAALDLVPEEPSTEAAGIALRQSCCGRCAAERWFHEAAVSMTRCRTSLGGAQPSPPEGRSPILGLPHHPATAVRCSSSCTPAIHPVHTQRFLEFRSRSVERHSHRLSTDSQRSGDLAVGHFAEVP